MINDKLQFSFGHILAFLSLMFLGYICFMGVCYRFSDFVIAGIAAASIVLLLLFVALLLQSLKASSRNFEDNRNRERAVFGLLVVCCIAAFIPFSHFWAVNSQSSQIKDEFREIVSSPKEMFSEYDRLTDERIAALDKVCDSLQTLETDGVIKYDSYRAALRLQLRPDSYERLKNQSLEWIRKASEGCSPWNIFLLGNVSELKSFIGNWNNELRGRYSHTMSLEPASGPLAVKPFPDMRKTSGEKISSLSLRYTSAGLSFGAPALALWLLCSVLLFLPWFLQKRHSRSPLRFLGRRKSLEEDDEDAATAGNTSENISISGRVSSMPEPTVEDKEDRTVVNNGGSFEF